MMDDSLSGSGYSEETVECLRRLVETARTNSENELDLRYEESDAGAVSLSWHWPEEDSR